VSASSTDPASVRIKTRDTWTFVNLKAFLAEAKVETNDQWEYPYHLTVTKAAYGVMLATIANNIDYLSFSEFKDEKYPEETQALCRPQVLVMEKENFQQMVAHHLGAAAKQQSETEEGEATPAKPEKIDPSTLKN
jgi:hypothetical protein